MLSFFFAAATLRLIADPLTLGESNSDRLAPPRLIAPGAPPLLAFRYFEGKDRHRFGQLDLVLDDAGH
jgi:hypothetical protein